jgi:hypothetical protein
MKIARFTLLFLFFVIVSCREDIVEFENENKFVGSISVDSQPEGALIFLHNENTDKKTPYVFVNLDPGSYPVTLKLDGYADTTIVKIVQANGSSSIEVSLSKK